MIKFTVKVPMEPVTEARRLCRVLRTGVQGLREQAEKLKEVDPVQDGLAAKDRADAQILEIQQNIASLEAEAAAEIAKYATAYIEAIDHQAGLKGQELTSAPDYELIKNALIDSAVELQKIADRNQDNYTLLAAIDRYATERQWHGFTLVSNAPVVLQFGDQWFKLCLIAAENPEGYAMTQILTPGELRRMLQAYGVLDAAEVPDDEA